jgi:hypothetical protein
MRDHYREIAEFFQICSDLFFTDLREFRLGLADILLRDVHGSFALDFHQTLPAALRHVPRFFRTDQPSLSVVNEIQCPGSGWGELSLLEEFYKETGALAEDSPSLAALFADAVHGLLAGDPRIHHLVDNASSLASNVYFINAIREADPSVKFYGFDRGIRPQNCNFVRTHLFEGLVTENLARLRRKQAVEGTLTYDYPLVCIYEQKVLMALPFLPGTHKYFSDRIRNLFPYTAVVMPSGVVLDDGEHYDINRLASLPRSRRRYFLKYGGADPSRNWGSRAVFYIGEMASARLSGLLQSVIQEYRDGRGVWVLQKAVSQTSAEEYYSPNGTIRSTNQYVKYSAFYGPGGLLGAMSMHRHTKKVHGQADTIRNLIVVR